MRKLDLRRKKILLTGGSGFLGGFVLKALTDFGAKKKNIIIPRSSSQNLLDRKVSEALTQNIDLVIHLAGNVGGIGKNRRYPATLFYENAIMGIELMEAARKNKVKKFVCIGTVCSYPKYTNAPFNEDDLWLGYPEETNAPYGLAKKLLLVQAQAYRKQYDFNAVYLIPVNLYGPHDNFHPEDSHVIPALIKKVFDAKKKGFGTVTFWGDGTPTREFLYVEDAARAIVLAAISYDKGEPVNLGSGKEISIADLASLIAKLIGFKGKINWDKSKPNGQPRRQLDVTRAKKAFGFSARTSFETGLKKTINWYRKKYV